ncbi:MAG: Na(+)/H(+) antiporter subunit B [Alphaproteobacteria bacterium]|nr:Na(+)/H(+) antiporter subunit B [Alphaproteobacteria bacterium]OJV14252.1 MAG: hypothetical protein BGO27_01985 [Alphaproteobacteria bacterium 33-17]
MSDDVIVRVIAKITIPIIFIFGLYIFMHGSVAPGGAFQAGAIFASAIIIYCLTNGTDSLLTIVSIKTLEKLIVMGVSIYAFIGFACIFKGGKFLEYKVLFEDPYQGQSLGIIGIEVGVALTVTTVITYIYLLFVRQD